MGEKGIRIDWSKEFAKLAQSLGDVGDATGQEMALDAAGVIRAEQLYEAIILRLEEGNPFFKGEQLPPGDQTRFLCTDEDLLSE